MSGASQSDERRAQYEFVTNGVHKGLEKKKEWLAPKKNVYFSVEILVPELIFTAIALNDFVRFHQEMIDPSMWNIHVATVRHFQTVVAAALEEEHYTVFLQMLHAKQPFYFRYVIQYADILNMEYLHLSFEERKRQLSAYTLRLLMEDDRYIALKEQAMTAASVTKHAVHELTIPIKYPETIDW